MRVQEECFFNWSMVCEFDPVLKCLGRHEMCEVVAYFLVRRKNSLNVILLSLLFVCISAFKSTDLYSRGLL
jgi:hypothetical protein